MSINNLESEQNLEKQPGQQWMDILTMRKNCKFYGSVDTGDVLHTMDSFISTHPDYYKKTLLGADSSAFDLWLRDQKARKDYSDNFLKFKKFASGTEKWRTGGEISTDDSMETFFLYTGFVYQSELSMQIMRFLSKDMVQQKKMRTLDYEKLLDQAIVDTLGLLGSSPEDLSRVQRLAATIDLKSREQEENQKDEKNTMKQSLSVPSPKTLTITDLSHINDPQILAVQEKQAYRINNQQKEAEKKQLIENTTLDVEEEKQRVRNKNLPFAKQDAPFNIQKDSSSELVDNKNHAATMDDDINAEPTAPMQLGYISIDPDFNIGKQYLFRDCFVVPKSFESFSSLMDGSKIKVAKVQQSICNGGIIWSLYNESKGYTFPDPQSFRDSNGVAVSVTIQYDAQNHVFVAQTAYTGTVSFDLYAPCQLSSAPAYIPHPQEDSPRGPIATAVFADAKVLMQKGAYDDAIALVKNYFSHGLYSPFAKDYQADVKQRCESPVGDCDVINEAFVAMLGSLGFTASLQYCYAENGDGVITNKESHAMTKIIMPDGKSVIVDATPSTPINKKVDEYADAPHISDNPLNAKIDRSHGENSQEQMAQNTDFFIHEFLEKIFQDPPLTEKEALKWMETIQKKQKPSSMEVVIYSVLYLMAYPYAHYDPKLYGLLESSNAVLDDMKVYRFFGEKFKNESIVAPVNRYELPLALPKNIRDIGIYAQYIINKGNFPLIEDGKIDQMRSENMYDKFDAAKVSWPMVDIIASASEDTNRDKKYTNVDEIKVEVKDGRISLYDQGLDDADFAYLVKKYHKEFLTVTDIDLPYNQITDLSPLRDLKKLQSINLDNNQITDLSPLKYLKNLSHLDCRNNQISDISPLQDLEDFYGLFLGDNQISDISPLKDLKNLYQIDFSDNQISDISPLRNLKHLQLVDFSGNQITDISPLRNLKGIESLFLGDNQITDISPLKDLKKLQQIDFTNNQISDISPVKDLKNTRDLVFSGNQITDISSVKNFKHLEYFNLSNNQITDLSPLKDLKHLSYLDCKNNQINDISFLKDLRHLWKLFFSNNQISDLSPLKDLKHLCRLECSNNQITDLSPLKNLEKLEQLKCSNNQITDLSPLKDLKKLRYLKCSNNQITDISSLKNLKDLHDLFVVNNNIKIIPKELKTLNNFFMDNNPITIELGDALIGTPDFDDDVKYLHDVCLVPGLGEVQGLAPNVSPLDPLFQTQTMTDEQRQDAYFRSMEKILCAKNEDRYLSLKSAFDDFARDMSIDYVQEQIEQHEGMTAENFLLYRQASTTKKSDGTLPSIVPPEYAPFEQELADKALSSDPRDWHLYSINDQEKKLGRNLVAHDPKMPFQGTFAIETSKNTFVRIDFAHATTLTSSYAQAQVLKVLFPQTFANVQSTIPYNGENANQKLENNASYTTIRSRIWDLQEQNKDIHDKIYSKLSSENKLILFDAMIKYHPDFYTLLVEYGGYTSGGIIAAQTSDEPGNTTSTDQEQYATFKNVRAQLAKQYIPTGNSTLSALTSQPSKKTNVLPTKQATYASALTVDDLFPVNGKKSGPEDDFLADRELYIKNKKKCFELAQQCIHNPGSGSILTYRLAKTTLKQMENQIQLKFTTQKKMIQDYFLSLDATKKLSLMDNLMSLYLGVEAMYPAHTNEELLVK